MSPFSLQRASILARDSKRHLLLSGSGPHRVVDSQIREGGEGLGRREMEWSIQIWSCLIFVAPF